MRTTGQGVISVLVLASIGMFAAGCSHDTLDSGTQALNVKYVPNPSGSGRFERAEFNISTLQVLPADPATAALYGSSALSLRFDPFTANLTLTDPVTFAQVALSPGTYNVKKIEFTSPVLVDENVSPTPATCIDGIAAIPSGPAGGQVPALTAFANPPSLTFTVRPGQTKLSLAVNVPGLIAGYESAFTCSPTFCGGQPCLTTFDQAIYADALLANISLE
jgi:hypothetical protein